LSPVKSDDLTVVVEEQPDGSFAVLRSPDNAEDKPAYREVVRFPSEAEALAWRL
jgi:hypothetical protein